MIYVAHYRIDPHSGKQTIISDSRKPYELRRPKGLSVHAPERLFLERKPRYRRYRGVLKMAWKPVPRTKKGAPLCPVVAFPNAGPR
jgi:hypothetical protein